MVFPIPASPFDQERSGTCGQAAEEPLDSSELRLTADDRVPHWAPYSSVEAALY